MQVGYFDAHALGQAGGPEHRTGEFNRLCRGVGTRDAQRPPARRPTSFARFLAQASPECGSVPAPALRPDAAAREARRDIERECRRLDEQSGGAAQRIEEGRFDAAIRPARHAQ